MTRKRHTTRYPGIYYRLVDETKEDRTISSILRIALRDFYNRRIENSHERT